MNNDLRPDENGRLEDIWGDVRVREKVPKAATLISPTSGYDGCLDIAVEARGTAATPSIPILPQKNPAKQRKITT